MKLTVNGVTHEIESGPLTPLLDVLREELGVTGTKAGCHQGGCGACTVLIGGEPYRSCLLPVAYADESDITTVEGLGSPEHLAPDPAGVHPPLRRAVRLLHVRHDARGPGVHRPWRLGRSTRLSRTPSAATYAAARVTRRSSTRSLRSRAATPST